MPDVVSPVSYIIHHASCLLRYAPCLAEDLLHIARRASHRAGTYHRLKIALKVKRFSNTLSISIPCPALLKQRVRVAGELLDILALSEVEAGRHSRAEGGNPQSRSCDRWARAEAESCQAVHSELDGCRVDLRSVRWELSGARARSTYVAETAIFSTSFYKMILIDHEY